MHRLDLRPPGAQGRGVYQQGLSAVRGPAYRRAMDNRAEVREFLVTRRAKISAADAGLPGWLTILSPLLMTWFLAKGTGKPLLEKDMAERRPGYVDYVRRTSGFVPWPPRKA